MDFDDVKIKLEKHSEKIHRHDVYLSVAAILLSILGLSGVLLYNKYSEAVSALEDVEQRATELEVIVSSQSIELTEQAERIRIDLDAFAKTKVGEYANPSINAVDRDRGCALWGDLQICWGSKELTANPRALHTAIFEFEFATPFGGMPSVTNGIKVHGSGHGMSVYRWNADKGKYWGSLNNMYVAVPVDGKITMSYIAIGPAAL